MSLIVTPCNKKSKTQNGDSTKNYRFKMIHNTLLNLHELRDYRHFCVICKKTRESASSWVPNTEKQMKARGRDVFSNETIRNYAVKCFL